MTVIDLTNEEFLKVIFKDDYKRAHVAGFPESPEEVVGYKWTGSKLGMNGHSFISSPHLKNTFYCISTFKDGVGEGGKSRAYRRHALHEATYAIMLDDVSCGDVKGSAKIDGKTFHTKYGVEPTAVIETSPGNAQWVFAIAPESDGERVKHFQSELVNLKLTKDGKDPGLRDTTRYARLPVGINNKVKYGTPWEHKVWLWEPGNRLTLDKLADKFGIKLPPRNTKPETTTPQAQPPPSDSTDLVLNALYQLELVKGERNGRPGMYDVICPWADGEDGHTDGDTTGSAYVSPAYKDSQGTEFPNGGYHCHHGHCEGRGVWDVRQWLIARGVLDDDIREDFADLIELKDLKEGEPNEKDDPGAILPLYERDSGIKKGWTHMTPPKREWLVDQVIPQGQVGVLVAPGGTGKSTICLQLGVAGAVGSKFLNTFEIDKPFKSEMLFGEESEEELQRRGYAIVQQELDMSMGDGKLDCDKIEESTFIKSMVGVPKSLTTKQNRQIEFSGILYRLIAAIKQRKDVKLVILDPASRFNGGEENNSEDATKFIEALELIALETGATVLAVHHANKNNVRGGDYSQAASRGSSALTDGARFQLHLSRPTPEEIKKHDLDDEAQYSHIKLYGTKNNYGKLTKPTWLRYVDGVYLPTELTVHSDHDIHRDGISDLVDEFVQAGGDLSQIEKRFKVRSFQSIPKAKYQDFAKELKEATIAMQFK